MSIGIRRHLRANIVGYVALFIALTGTAVALPGKNNVKAKNIAPNAVTTPKIKNHAVTTAKIGSSAVTAADLASNAVSASKVADGSLIGADILDDALTGADIDESSLGQVPSAVMANSANTANNAANADAVDGVSALVVDLETTGITAVDVGPFDVELNCIDTITGHSVIKSDLTSITTEATAMASSHEFPSNGLESDASTNFRSVGGVGDPTVVLGNVGNFENGQAVIETSSNVIGAPDFTYVLDYRARMNSATSPDTCSLNGILTSGSS